MIGEITILSKRCLTGKLRIAKKKETASKVYCREAGKAGRKL